MAKEREKVRRECQDKIMRQTLDICKMFIHLNSEDVTRICSHQNASLSRSECSVYVMVNILDVSKFLKEKLDE